MCPKHTQEKPKRNSKQTQEKTKKNSRENQEKPDKTTKMQRRHNLAIAASSNFFLNNRVLLCQAVDVLGKA